MLTIDRFIAIVKAIEYRSIMTKNKYIIYTLFLLSHHIIVFFVSYMFFPNNEKWAKRDQLLVLECIPANLLNTNARYYMVGFVTLLVLITLGLCITLVIYLIKQVKRKSLHQGGSGSNNLTKATNTLIIVSTLYACLYIQLIVIGFLASTLEMSRNADAGWEMAKLRHLSDHLFTVNNFINPLIYYIRMPEFRKEFHSLLLCRSRH